MSNTETKTLRTKCRGISRPKLESQEPQACSQYPTGRKKTTSNEKTEDKKPILSCSDETVRSTVAGRSLKEKGEIWWELKICPAPADVKRVSK